jgi:type IV secretory pathway TraG/TraD family ATPase VirD4
MRATDSTDHLTDLGLWLLGVLLALAGMLAASAHLASLITTGGWAHGGDLTSGLGVLADPGDPASAWPAGSGVPGPVGYWTTFATLIVLAGLVGVAGWRIRDRLRSGSGAARTRLHSTPGLASRGEIAGHASRRAVQRRARTARPSVDRFESSEMGQLLGHARGREVWSSVEDSRLLLGPPRSGKGLHLVVPTILDAPGAVVTTSTRPDNVVATLTARQQQGPVAVFDPQDLAGLPAGLRWSPIHGCEDPQTAMVRARGLAAGAGFSHGGVTDAAFWQGQTEGVLRAILHAAALGGEGIDRLYAWSLDPVAAEDAVRTLNRSPAAADGWGDGLDATIGMDARTRDSIWAGVRSSMAALADPLVRRSLDPQAGEELDLHRFLTHRGTLYLLGTGAGIGACAAFLAALVEDVTETARRLAARAPGGRLDPPLSLVLDEIANLSPLPSLPMLMADGGGNGICTTVVLQSLAQARAKWGEQPAAAIWDAATVKVILGGASNPRDLHDLSQLIGERDEATISTSRGPHSGKSTSTSLRRVPILPPDMLRTLPFGTAVLLLRTTRPILLDLHPYTDRAGLSPVQLDPVRRTR